MGKLNSKYIMNNKLPYSPFNFLPYLLFSFVHIGTPELMFSNDINDFPKTTCI